MEIIGSSKRIAVVGIGVTGISVARFLAARGSSFCMFDTREEPPGLKVFFDEFPNISVSLGDIDESALCEFEEVIVSPGISLQEPFLKQVMKKGISVVGDIELFLREVTSLVVGITGSNGKTTVATLVGECAKEEDLKVKVGGNIGIPALDLIEDDVQLYILELSSFQLETIGRANLDVACNLNVTPDHMDRYESFAHYVAAKQKIFYGAKSVVFNGADVLTHPPFIDGIQRKQFSVEKKIEESAMQYYWDAQERILMCESEPLMGSDDVRIKGIHNLQNALSVYAICDSIGIARNSVTRVLHKFQGLKHRCELVKEHQGILFVNDSKATNIGAAEAAITGFVKLSHNVILIAGGDGKGVDFKSFSECIEDNVSALVLIGKDAEKIEQHLNKNFPCVRAGSMEEAVALANKFTKQNSVVLLSPACASIDMYSGYEERGDAFCRAVAKVVA